MALPRKAFQWSLIATEADKLKENEQLLHWADSNESTQKKEQKKTNSDDYFKLHYSDSSEDSKKSNSDDYFQLYYSDNSEDFKKRPEKSGKDSGRIQPVGSKEEEEEEYKEARM